MDIRPLRSEDDYDRALKEIEPYFDRTPEPGSPDGDRFDLLAMVIADYEDKHWAIEAPEAPDALRERMRQLGLTQKDLGSLLGSKARASEVLNRRRHLTLEQAWTLHSRWHIPADCLIRPYPLRRATPRAAARDDRG